MNKLFQAIELEDISEIEIYLKAFITGNPSDSDNTIKQALKQIESKNLNVWEKHDGATFQNNRKDWTEDYFVDLQVDLRMNFSKERFMHMLEVGKEAFPASVEQPKVTIKQNEITSKTTSTTNNTNRKKDRTLLYMGIAGVAVVVLAVVLVKLIKNS